MSDFEIVDVPEHELIPPHQDQYLLLDVGDIFDEMEQAIRMGGEIPIHNRYHENMGSFVEEIYNSLGYLPRFSPAAVRNIENILQMCGIFFDHYTFTPLQREQWYVMAQRLVQRMQDYRLYNHRYENMYDYHCLDGDTLVLKLFE